jgi:hypothetical protein
VGNAATGEDDRLDTKDKGKLLSTETKMGPTCVFVEKFAQRSVGAAAAATATWHAAIKIVVDLSSLKQLHPVTGDKDVQAITDSERLRVLNSAHDATKRSSVRFRSRISSPRLT